MIELNNVGYEFGDTKILSDVNLTIHDGTFHFLTGPSGSGKTTFLRLCYMDLIPTVGKISHFAQKAPLVERDDIARLRQRIGVVHQDCQFVDHLSVAENVSLPLRVSGRGDGGENLDDLLAWVGLGHRRDAKPTELSGGERQRAALARAVILSPEIIIADEPTGNVDWEMSQRLIALLIELNAMGKTILLATHDLGLIRAAKQKTSTRVLRIRERDVQLAGADL